jgi:hypothetical protein
MNTAGDGTNELIIAPSQDLRPATLFAPTRKAARRFLEFFTAQINTASATLTGYLQFARHKAAEQNFMGPHQSRVKVRQIANRCSVHPQINFLLRLDGCSNQDR